MSGSIGIYAKRRKNCLVPLAEDLRSYIESLFIDCYVNIDSITARAKTVESYEKKAKRKQEGSEEQHYSDPLSQIQDQIGARIVVFYQLEIEVIDSIIQEYFVSYESVYKEPEEPHEFGYIGKHYILGSPLDLKKDEYTDCDFPPFFELQIKTLFQHAWGQANHDLCVLK